MCLAGRIAAPFTTLTLILGIEPTLVLMLENPALLRRFEEFFLEFNDRVARLQLEAGADALWLGDCVATSHFISPAQFEEHAAEFAAASARRDPGGRRHRVLPRQREVHSASGASWPGWASTRSTSGKGWTSGR